MWGFDGPTARLYLLGMKTRWPLGRLRGSVGWLAGARAAYFMTRVSSLAPGGTALGNTGGAGGWSQRGAGTEGMILEPGVDASPDITSFSLKRADLPCLHKEGGVSGLALVGLPDNADGPRVGIRLTEGTEAASSAVPETP